jgi:hypothetical protein
VTEALTLRIPVEDSLTDDELFRICSANKELRIEVIGFDKKTKWRKRAFGF